MCPSKQKKDVYKTIRYILRDRNRNLLFDEKEEYSHYHNLNFNSTHFQESKLSTSSPFFFLNIRIKIRISFSNSNKNIIVIKKREEDFLTQILDIHARIISRYLYFYIEQ